jgi:hypothetical protein
MYAGDEFYDDEVTSGSSEPDEIQHDYLDDEGPRYVQVWKNESENRLAGVEVNEAGRPVAAIGLKGHLPHVIDAFLETGCCDEFEDISPTLLAELLENPAQWKFQEGARHCQS